MKDLSVPPVSQQTAWTEKQPSDSASTPDRGGTTETAPTLSDYAAEESKSLAEMIQNAQEKAEAHRSALKLSKNTPRYGDAPLEAYARLARAKSVSEVQSASGYARRRLAQMKGYLHVDSENAAKIRAAINQLQKAVNRAERKKRDLTREKQAEQRKARAEEAELRRRKIQRKFRESGYMQEAHVSDQLASHLTATQMELRQQAQSLSASPAASSIDAAVQQYAAAAAPPPAPEINVEGSV